MKRRKFLARTLLTGAAGCGGVAVYGRWLERHRVEVVRQVMRVGSGFPAPLSVAVLGDIHFDPLCESAYLREVVRKVNSLSPDLVLFTGDFMTSSTEALGELVGILSHTAARLGSNAVLGNHDHWVGATAVAGALSDAGITVLRNQSVPIPGGENWFVSGLESYWSGKPSLRSIEASPPDSRHLLLVHEPDSFDGLDDSRIALQISGHTHGGQIRVPGIGALQLPSFGRRYQMGVYRKGDRCLYVNRGIGTVDHHYRINCRPEITLLQLES